MLANARDHYNHVTDAWKEFMGDNFHFGYFETEEMEISRAAEILIEKMLELCSVSEDSRILDVGCGIGAPAFYIHEKLGCAIDGISTSERGIQLATESSREKGYHDVRFKVADGLSNGFPDGTFDIVWIMEASHLMPDKRGLARECLRVLKENGTLVLCDLLMMLPIQRLLWHFMTNARRDMQVLKTFGPAALISLGTYCNVLIEAGFREVTVIDITQQTLPTMRSWKENALRSDNGETHTFSLEDVRQFAYGCEILEDFFNNGVLGYGMLRAMK